MTGRKRHSQHKEQNVQIATQTELKVGQWVTVNSWCGRRQKIVEVCVNQLGTTIYILRDGGRFDATEIKAA
jgi:hypothetical protein